MRLLIPCAIISYDALTDFIGHISKRDRHKYQDNEVEKERHELVFRIQSNIYDGALLQRLTAKSFIVDIRPGSKYPSDERNKLFSFSIKATLKSYYFRYLHVLYRTTTLEKSESLTCYPMFLCKRDSTADIFLWTFKLFLDKLFHKAVPNHWL